MSYIADRYAHISARIEDACHRAGRAVTDVRLMAVTKRQPVEVIAEAASLGIRLFGENRVQETKEKRHLFPADGELHLIGHLQRNKAKDAAGLYDAVQSLDAVRTVVELEKRLAAEGRVLPVMVEVNTSGEESKQGVETEDQLFTVVDAIMSSPHMLLNGLMTIGPISRDEIVLRTAFARLKKMHEDVGARYRVELQECSMGMSNDIEEAILEGSTMVRVGTALFGARDT